MNLSDAMRNAIRSDATTRIYNQLTGSTTAHGEIEIGCYPFDLPTVRALMRLGLCVVEAREKYVSGEYMDSHEAWSRVSRAALELEASALRKEGER